MTALEKYVEKLPEDAQEKAKYTEELQKLQRKRDGPQVLEASNYIVSIIKCLCVCMLMKM